MQISMSRFGIEWHALHTGIGAVPSTDSGQIICFEMLGYA